MADSVVDAKYSPMRDRFGADQGRANGYILDWFFRREQAFLLPRIGSGRVLDIACGSALMLRALKDKHEIIGVDFNQLACSQAQQNQMLVVRGDAFSLPFDNSGFDVIINCQFFNQQDACQVDRFLKEASRTLKDGGQLHLLWRNGDSLIHRVTHRLIGLINKMMGRPEFPHFVHSPDWLITLSQRFGLKLVDACTTLPIGPAFVARGSWLAPLLGASNYILLQKSSTAEAQGNLKG